MSEGASHDLPDHELAVLGAGIEGEEAWALISETLTDRDFATPAHAELYAILQRGEEEGWRGDPILTAQALREAGHDGHAIVSAASTSAAPTTALATYFTALQEKTFQRDADREARRTQRALEDCDDHQERLALITEHQEALWALSDRATGEPWTSVGDILKDVEQGDTRLVATLPTGFPDLDRVLQGGFRQSQMVAIAGRPSMGKSTIAVDLARYAAFRRGIPGLFVSLEMSKEELGVRIVAAEGSIPMKALIEGDLDEADQETVARVRDQLEDSPLSVLDAAESSWGSIRAAITSAHRREGIQFAVIDYLQLVSLEDKAKSMGRQEEVSTISRGIKLLAKRLGITIFALSQLNRGAEHRPGQVPQMSDLRESGSIEQDSDIVTLVHRPDVYDQMSERAGEADLIVAKQRNGPTGTVAFSFQGHYSRFMSLAYTSDAANEPYPMA